MRSTTIKSTKLLLLIAVVLLMVFKIYNLNKIDFDVDVMDKQFAPLKKYLRPGAKVGIRCVKQYEGDLQAMEYVMAPIILVSGRPTDTLILVESDSVKLADFGHFHIIAQNDNGTRSVSLVNRIK